MGFPLYFTYLFRLYFRSILFTFLLLATAILAIDLAFHQFGLGKSLFFHLVALFVKRFDFIIPISCLIGSIVTITNLHKNNELAALEISGIAKGKLIAPFFSLTFLVALVIYFNHQFIIPTTNTWLFEEQKKKKNSSLHDEEYEVRILSDGSRIIYSTNDQQLQDLFWIKSHHEIWHAEKIIFEDELPIGVYVDKLSKNSQGQYVKSASFHKYALPNSFLKAKPKVEKTTELPIDILFNLLTHHSLSMAFDKGFVYSQLCNKLISPWFSMLAITAMLPFLLPYTRKIKIINQLVASLLGFLFFHYFLKVMTILSEHYFISPFITIILLPIILQSVLFYRLWRTLKYRPVLLTRKNS